MARKRDKSSAHIHLVLTVRSVLCGTGDEEVPAYDIGHSGFTVDPTAAGLRDWPPKTEDETLAWLRAAIGRTLAAAIPVESPGVDALAQHELEHWLSEFKRLEHEQALEDALSPGQRAN